MLVGLRVDFGRCCGLVWVGMRVSMRVDVGGCEGNSEGKCEGR